MIHLNPHKHVAFSGRLIMVGFGSVGQGVLPLILRHIDMGSEQITIVTADHRGHDEALEYGINFIVNALTEENYEAVLGTLLGPGDFLLNVSVDVSSIALMELCHELGAMYMDTCIEPWAGGYTDPSLSQSQRSNYAMRENMLSLRARLAKGPTAISAHGANPGLVSHWVKQAMMNLAEDHEIDLKTPKTRAEWANLAMKLGVKVIHCAEHDTQVAEPQKRTSEFVNTWSVDGFVGEGCQPAELGWGSHEKHFPFDAHRHDFGCDSAIYLNRPGILTRVRSWTPLEGPFHGFLITHGESISIADCLTVRDTEGNVVYRPTVHYSYHPCDAGVLSLHELAGKNFQFQESRRVLMEDIIEGIDELGALLMGDRFGAYFYGSQLSIHEARKLAPYNNATTLQVSAGILGAMVWSMRNPQAGILDPEDICYETVLSVANPYLGRRVGTYSDWTPLENRTPLFNEELDHEDPWQFKNFRVL